MRFIITASAGEGPAQDPAAQGNFEDLFARYMKFNEDLHRAGILIASEGLKPDSKYARIGVSNGQRVVLDGPFVESKELVGGFYIVEVPSLDDAVAWALKCPTGLGSDNVLEIRPLTGSEDIPPHLLELCAKVAPEWSATFVKDGR